VLAHLNQACETKEHAAVRIRESATSGLGAEHGSNRDAVCVEKSVDGSQEALDFSAIGASANENHWVTRSTTGAKPVLMVNLRQSSFNADNA
jgi:hypothetical protein